MRKRRRESSTERIKRKIRKYEEKLERRGRRRSITPPFTRSPSLQCLDDEISENYIAPPPHGDDDTVGDQIPSGLPPAIPPGEDGACAGAGVVGAGAEVGVVEAGGGGPADILQPDVEQRKDEDEPLDEDVLALLGDAPQETKFGPPIHKDLAARWADIIKKGLDKDKRKEIKEKYLPPGNCKTIDAPKLNLEAQAATTEAAVKRDKAMAQKQTQLGCALTALGMALGKLCQKKDKENLPIINIISDASRLLCDHQHQESTTRRNFILSGLEQTTRDSVKDTEVDTWLFGESFPDKLKASKAIKKSGQEISKNKKPHPSKHLNYKGPTGMQQKSRPPPRFGPPASYQHTSYQHIRKPLPSLRIQPQNKPPLQRPVNNNRR